MILWLNGPYGVGKSTLAEAIREKFPDCFVFDAEQVGNAIRDNMPEEFYHETFEEYPLWLDVCVHLLAEIGLGFPGHVLVPMTLARNESLAIFDRLRQAGVEAYHVLLAADSAEIRARIVERGETEDCWCAQQVEKCLCSQRQMPCDLCLDASRSPAELAKKIIEEYRL